MGELWLLSPSVAILVMDKLCTPENILAFSQFFLSLKFPCWVMVCSDHPLVVCVLLVTAAESLSVFDSTLLCLNNRTEKKTQKWY